MINLMIINDAPIPTSTSLTSRPKARGRHNSVYRIRWDGKTNSGEGTRGARNHSVHTLQAHNHGWIVSGVAVFNKT